MPYLPHIVSPLSAAWCGWTMLCLLLTAVLGEWLQPGVISQAYDSLVVRTERTYKDAPVNTIGQFFVALFRIGTIGMGLCLCLEPEGRFAFISFGAVSGVIIAVLLVKMLCNALVSYTFELSRRFAGTYEMYGNIMTLACLALYPALLLSMRFGTIIAHRWVLGGAAVFFLLLWIYRSFRQFVISPKVVLYWLVYVATLELLPLGALYYLSEKMLSQL